ncbi:NlpC/P60 family protein [Pseudonocardia sp. RS11V-5]|uniref:NlpC/P60 family protein n=1 Tax=Pseudonocardia terrae TaxID=2905831 RepID=UPI001E42A7E4|nr:NlpC/P60 family protein [Pseudonocardia terrae]MCE3556003.1 NlpC/P60 family protein [Pseudonocardia terrae]
MSDTCVAPRAVLVPSSRHSAEDRSDGQGLSAADLIARLTGSSAPPPSGGRRARRAAEEDEAPVSPLGVPAAGELPDERPQARVDEAPTSILPQVGPAPSPAPQARPADEPPAGLTGSFFTSGLGSGRGGDGLSLTGVLPALTAAIRSPKTVAAAATVTVMGATAVLTGLPTPGGQMAQATDGGSPSVRLAAADATLTSHDDGSGTSGTAAGAGTTDDRPTQVLQAVQDGPGAVGGSMQSAFGTAMGTLPQVFEKADAAGIAAVQKAEAAKAAEEQQNALRRAAQSAAGGIGDAAGDAVDDTVGQATGVGAKALAAARTRLGMPYVWGASGPNAFDCSGLTSWAFKQAGVSLPRTSAAQSTVGTAVSKDQLQPGDLVFFYSPVSHVGIYLGDGKVLHASTSGEPVKISNVADMPFHNARRV